MIRKKVIKKSGKFTTAKTKVLVKNSSREYSTNSYKNFFYGGLSVVLLIAVALGIFRIYSTNNKKNIADEGLRVSRQEENLAAKKNEKVKGSTPTEYTIVEGDSLWKISENFYNDGYKWTEIAKANKLENPGMIFKGNKLTIPKIESVSQIANSSTNNQTLLASNNKIESKEYSVEKGDYLWKIALLAYGDGYKWTEIAKANNLSNPSIIHSGNKLVIPR